MSADAPAEGGQWIPPSNAGTGKQEAGMAGMAGMAGRASSRPASVEMLPKEQCNNSQQQQRPQSTISAASSDDQSDLFSSYDSRRSTVSSVYSADSSSTPQEHQHQQKLQQYPSPSSSPQRTLTRTRGNAKHLQAERQRRRAESTATTASGTGSTCDDDDASLNSSPLRRKRGASRKYQTANPQAALAATEPPHENLLTKMAFAEQQRWITVQQKTFTKWLNTKIEARGLEIQDLVKDLSDGVSRALDSTPSTCLANVSFLP